MRCSKKRSQRYEKLYYPWQNAGTWHSDHGREFFDISHTHFRLRKKTENKKCKILDKRSFNMQRHRRKRRFYLDFAYSTWKRAQNAKDFVLISGQVGDILCLCTLKGRLSRILKFLFSFFFLSRKWLCMLLKITFLYPLCNKMQKLQG